jgi:choline dehydrogenase-like flavoprotein
MRRVLESDVCIIGSGISAAMIAARLAEQSSATITVVEAGAESDRPAERHGLRRRFLDYGESPWRQDHLEGHQVDGIQSRSMQVGGLAMHWGGVTPRWSPEDFRIRSLYGVGDDWPIDYETLDPWYQEAEVRLGVSGEQGPPALDPRGHPFPQPAIPLSYNLELLRGWAGQAEIAMWSQPSAKNSVPYAGRPACCRNDTCFPVCPIGAKYSPDHTWTPLRESGRVELIPRTVVRRLEVEGASPRITRALARRLDDGAELELRARQFVVAAGYVWSSHLLLLSRSSRFPDGLANRSGLVGRYVAGHRNVGGQVSLPLRLFPGLNEQHSLVSKQFMRASQGRYLRHDLRVWESTAGRDPRLGDAGGRLLLGDALLQDWRRRSETGAARVRAYYDVLPDRESRISLDPVKRTPWDDPLPRLDLRDDPVSAELRGDSEQRIRALFERMALAGGGTVLSVRSDSFQDHPAGGCRMGADPSRSVTDSWGRSHDHDNLFIAGAPTCVTAGCANGTLTFCALALRSASAIAGELAASR